MKQAWKCTVSGQFWKSRSVIAHRILSREKQLLKKHCISKGNVRFEAKSDKYEYFKCVDTSIYTTMFPPCPGNGCTIDHTRF